MNTIHFMKSGKWRADDGKAYEFTPDILHDIADGYNKSVHEAPIVIGHPKMDSPAYGWVQAIRATDDGLEAEPGDEIAPRMQQWLNDKLYKKVSPSLYAPDDPSNPTPGKWYLRHIGFLGAKPPAIKGLRQTQFSDGGGVLFGEMVADIDDDPGSLPDEPEGNNMPDEKNPNLDQKLNDDQLKAFEEALSAEKAKLAHLYDEKIASIEAREKVIADKEKDALTESNKAFISGLKLTPVQTAGMAAFMAQLGEIEKSVSFAEPGQDESKEESLLDYFKELMRRLSARGPNFGELTPGATADDLKPDSKPAFIRAIEEGAKKLREDFDKQKAIK